MSETKKYTCKCGNCDREFGEEEFKLTNDENKCILHCEKDDWYEIGNENKKTWNKFKKNIKVFWEEVRKYKKEIDISLVEEYNFDFIFPEFESLSLDKEYNFFYLKNSNDINRKMIKKANFYNSVFLDFADFSFILFEKEVSFCFIKSVQILFSSSIFCDKFKFLQLPNSFNSVIIDSNTFKNDVYIFSENIELKIIGTIFEERFKLDGTNIRIDIFKDNTFKSTNDFSKISILNELLIDNCKFFDDITFNNSTIHKLDLSNSIYHKKLKFLNLKTDVLNRETARIIKDSFEQQNNIIEANKFYALEMKEYEKELKFLKKPLEWLVFKAHELSSNHSQDWFLSLLWIIIFSFVVGLFNQEYYYEVDKYIFINIILLIPFYIGFKFEGVNRKIGLGIFIILFYWVTSINLDFVSNIINPFSIMTGKENLTFGTLIFKIIIAYLIYQLIISIRQNTRRK